MKSGNSPLHLVCAALALSCGAASLAAQTPASQQPEPPPATTAPATTTPAATVPAVTSPAPGQPAEQSDGLTNAPTLQMRDDKVLESFAAGANEEYTIGAGDDISLRFPGHADMNNKMTVGPDGRISVDPAPAIRVVDLTRDGAAEAIKKALSPYFNDLSVTVSIEKYSSNQVKVLGFVERPGPQLLEGQPTLLDAILKAGVITQKSTGVGGAQVNTSSSIPEICTVYRGNNIAVQVHLRELLMSNDPHANLPLRRNDIVVVPEPEESFVSVLGQVTKPGTVALTRQSTLTSVLAEAGCCSENGGFNPKIHIIQNSTHKDFQVSYKEIMTLSGQQEFKLHSGDTIIVPWSGWAKFTTTLQKVSGVATMVSVAALVGAG
jgi:polysaccharide export outer membrane protein